MNPQGIQVIGAGLGRTGTQSLLKALTILGYKPYHMKEGVLETPGQLERWVKLAQDRNAAVQDELVRSIVDLGFNATLDYPVRAI